MYRSPMEQNRKSKINSIGSMESKGGLLNRKRQLHGKLRKRPNQNQILHSTLKQQQQKSLKCNNINCI